MKGLGFPIRADSAQTPITLLAIAGKLTGTDLTTHGYERRVLKRLTEECKECGAFFRCKILEED